MKPPFNIRNRYLLIGDIFLIAFSVVGSFALRLELGQQFLFYFPQLIWMVVIALLIKPIVYNKLGLYRRIWVYASTGELKLITLAVSLASLLVAIGIFVLTSLQISYGFFIGFPRSVVAIDWILSLLLVGGLRFSLLLLIENRANGENDHEGARRVLVFGAGSAGDLVVRELQKNPQVNHLPVCFLDDDPDKLEHQVHGIPVEGTLADLPWVVRSRRIDEVIIAIPSQPGRVVRRVADSCRKAGVPFRTMPGIYELLGGNINLARLREVDITDLLRRQPAQIDSDLVGTILNGKRVLISGAGGSVGLELCRQIARWGPSDIILLGHGENSIFEALLELETNFPSLPMYPIIADIRDTTRLDSIFEKHRPEVVFHAAAHKHVTLMEVNVVEAVTNNILGTQNVLDMADSFEVERLVMISSDKAVNPTSVMGATKRIAEMLVIDKAHRTGRPLSVVRFGNVLGSRGSIVPVFNKQIAKGGPVTITHPDMKRFFMTIPEAIHLVLQSAAMGNGGEIFMLNMGKQVRILNLAEDLIRLSGLEPGHDIEIEFTGIRPGEKLSEDSWDERSDNKPTSHPKIMRLVRDEYLNGTLVTEAVNELVQLARENDTTAVLRLLDELIPGATVSTTPPPYLISIV